MKKCYKCKVEKEVSMFSLTPSGNPRGVCKACRVISSTAYLYKNTYGITLEEAEILKEKQNFKCAICGVNEREHSRGVLFVDHCHTEGNVRGMLCSQCNTGLGMFKDDVEVMQKAIAYLLKGVVNG